MKRAMTETSSWGFCTACPRGVFQVGGSGEQRDLLTYPRDRGYCSGRRPVLWGHGENDAVLLYWRAEMRGKAEEGRLGKRANLFRIREAQMSGVSGTGPRAVWKGRYLQRRLQGPVLAIWR